MKGGLHTPPSRRHGNLLYCVMLLSGKLLGPNASWNQITVAHSMMGDGRLWSDFCTDSLGFTAFWLLFQVTHVDLVKVTTPEWGAIGHDSSVSCEVFFHRKLSTSQREGAASKELRGKLQRIHVRATSKTNSGDGFWDSPNTNTQQLCQFKKAIRVFIKGI